MDTAQHRELVDKVIGSPYSAALEIGGLRNDVARLRSALNTIANSECQNFDAPMLRAVAAGALKHNSNSEASALLD